jgi:hypothetical protein
MADESREQSVRVSGREGEEVVWSRKAARRAGRLTNWLDDLNPSEDTIFPVEETCATVLRTLGAMCDDDWSASCLDECSPTQLATLIEGASNLLAEQALEYAQTAFACRLDGKCVNELRELLGAVDDFESDEERVAALAEPAFMPDSPMPQLTTAAALPVNDDAAEAALGKVGVATLIELKGVNRAWRALGRRALCSRLCRREGHADPRQLHDITELNLELLIEAGRPWEAARAGRLLLHLERLTGYGFVVDVAAVRQVKLDDDGREEEEEEEEQLPIPLLRGPAKHALCSCVTGEGEPPLDLLVGAIACAGSGRIRGISVQRLRADAFTNIEWWFDLAENCIGPKGAILIASFIPVMGGMTSIDLSGNQLCGILTDWRGDQQGTYTAEGITAIADALHFNGGLARVDVRYNDISGDGAAQLSTAVLGNLKIEMFNEIPIKEMRANSFTELDLKEKGFGVEGGMVVAGLMPVMGGLTALDLSSNSLKDEGVSAVCEAIQSNKETMLASLNFKDNGIGPVGSKSVAAMVAVTGGLTKMSLAQNELGEEGTKAICEALEQNKTLKELDISGAEYKGNIGGSAGAKHVAKMLGVNGRLTKISLARNNLEEEGTKAICEALEQNTTLKELDISGHQEYSNIGGSAGAKHVAKMVRVNDGLTALDLSCNDLKVEGVSAVCEAIQSNKETKLASLNMGASSIGPM